MNVYYTAASNNYKYKRSDIKCFNDCGIFTNEVMEAKRYKVLGHLFYPDHDILVWSDANISLNISIDDAIKKYLGDNDLMVFPHPKRNCLYKEIEVIRKTQRLQNPYLQQQINRQEKQYRKQGHPSNFGLWECNFIIRRNTKYVNAIFDAWWAEICRWQWRDQVSFPIAVNKFRGKIKFTSPNCGDIRLNKDFTYLNHY